MPVLTQEEYEKYRKSGMVQGGIVPPTIPDVKEEQSIEYWLLYPEIEKGEPLPSFQDVIKLGGIEYKRVCERGIVKTKDKPLYEFLKKKGYGLMHKENVE